MSGGSVGVSVVCENGCVRILERESELELLERAVEDACRWRGSVVLASGEAGIGKTTIVRLLRDLSAGRARLAVGRCEPLSVPEPLGPLRDIAIVVPGIGAALAGCDAPGVARALCAACTEPMVVVVEDAHWADGLTLDAVRLVARRA